MEPTQSVTPRMDSSVQTNTSEQDLISALSESLSGDTLNLCDKNIELFATQLFEGINIFNKYGTLETFRKRAIAALGGLVSNTKLGADRRKEAIHKLREVTFSDNVAASEQALAEFVGLIGTFREIVSNTALIGDLRCEAIFSLIAVASHDNEAARTKVLTAFETLIGTFITNIQVLLEALSSSTVSAA